MEVNNHHDTPTGHAGDTPEIIQQNSRNVSAVLQRLAITRGPMAKWMRDEYEQAGAKLSD